jgi:hypothetical protein
MNGKSERKGGKRAVRNFIICAVAANISRIIRMVFGT